MSSQRNHIPARRSTAHPHVGGIGNGCRGKRMRTKSRPATRVDDRGDDAGGRSDDGVKAKGAPRMGAAPPPIG